MKFARPEWLAFLAITITAAALFLAWSRRKKLDLLSRFIPARLQEQLMSGVSPRHQMIRDLLWLFGLAFIMVALARPQWGYRMEEVRQRGLDILVAVDTSRSMLAEDTSPDRLRRAKLAILDLMRQAKTDRLGLIAFAGTAFLQCPLTLDDEAFRQSVEALDVNIIPQGGTSLAAPIHTALEAFQKSEDNHRALVLITDGEDHEAGLEEAIQEAQRAEMRVYVVGVGSGEGEVLRERDESGVTRFIQGPDGQAIKSRLNENLLQEIAQQTGGFYVPLRGANVMEQLYERGLALLPKSEYAERLMRQYYERFQWPLAFGILFLVTEMFCPRKLRLLSRNRGVQEGPAAGPAVLLLLILSTATSAFGSSASAKRLYDQGKYAEAQKEYERLLQSNTNDARLQLNAGIAAYQSKDYPTATNYFGRAAQAPELQWQQQAYYNLGNALYRAGESEESMKRDFWEKAVKNYQNALALKKDDTNAQYNLEFVRKKIAELPQPPPQPSPQDQPPQQDTNAPPEQAQSPSTPQPQQQTPQESKPQPDPSNKDSEDQSPQANQPREQETKPADDADQQPSSPESATPPASGETNNAGVAGKPQPMSPQEAQRLLDAQKADEKALIFAPPERPQEKKILKDW
ncbi:MAG TPA: VWA domain-containing protein [Candidatus Paceibacterota bacterium]|nr:VWA domain-containing protein [Verrucomicrobiota bacterium]HRY47929.1 VWA domain-containing protein [Candidatus Paceibacterota bacterium]